jgi:cysteine synthase A
VCRLKPPRLKISREGEAFCRGLDIFSFIAYRSGEFVRIRAKNPFWRVPMRTDNVLDLVGNTPLIQLRGETIFAKAEFLNPGGSVKDRVALAMLEGARRDGKLHDGSVIVEPTSGNTGIGLALVGRQMGYRVVIVMPENMSDERKKLIRALGAELLLTPAADSIDGAVRKANELAAADANVFMPNQFENLDNPKVHYEQTAQEIWRQSRGEVAAFVAGVGSGGTLQGVGTFLREHNPAVKIIAVEPKNVSALLGHEPGLHQIQGIGDGFIPGVLDVSLVDDVVEVTDEAAIETTRELGSNLGLLVGISSGANVWAARQIAPRIEGNVVTVLPDRAERYFSTALM